MRSREEYVAENEECLRIAGRDEKNAAIASIGWAILASIAEPVDVNLRFFPGDHCATTIHTADEKSPNVHLSLDLIVVSDRGGDAISCRTSSGDEMIVKREDLRLINRNPKHKET